MYEAYPHLEEHFGISHSVEEPLPPCHLRLPSATYDDIQTSIKVIQKFDCRRQ